MSWLVLSLLLGAATASPINNERIWNGQIADRGEYPYQVSLQVVFDGQVGTFCGGSIIDENRVLTAAHCWPNLDTEFEVYAHFGDYNLLENDVGESSIKVVRHVHHQNYSSAYIAVNDVAIYYLEKPIEFNDVIQPITLIRDEFDPTGMTCTVTGYGRTEDAPVSTILREVEVTVITDERCKKEWLLHDQTTFETELCTQSPGYVAEGFCQGDSGGPLVCEYEGSSYQVGIVSWGPSICRDNYPNVYTEISYFRDWIDSH